MKKQAGDLNTEIESDPEYAEGSMAKYELKAIIEHASELEKHLNGNEKLEPWVETKITKAKDYIESVTDYLLHSDDHEQGPHEGGEAYTAVDYRSRIKNAAKKKKGLWDRIRAKKNRGESPAKPGDKDYPDKKQWDKLSK